MYLPNKNKYIFGFFISFSVIILSLAVIFPALRAVAYAPLRDLILPPPEPIIISLLYSTEKADWLDEVIQDFYRTNPRVNGRSIELTLKKMGSREMILEVMDGQEQPVIISPAGSLQISILEDLSASKYGEPIVKLNDASICTKVLKSPLVLVAWRERAKVLWGESLPSDLWQSLHDSLIDPQGWAAVGHPEWGYIKLGQTNPLKSNSGFMTLLLMTYGYYGKSSNLTFSDIQDNPNFQTWLLEIENSISKFGDSTGTYMEEIVTYGPSMYDIVAVYEATAIENAEYALGRYGELRIYYPPQTIISDHPFCLVNAEWVSEQQVEAARVFIEYLIGEEAQRIAMINYGFRPVTSGISLEQPGSPFTKFATNGIQMDLPPEVEIPDGAVLNTLLDFWSRNVLHSSN